MNPEEEILAEQARLEPWLNEQEGVTGTGVGLGKSGQPCLLVFTDHLAAEVRTKIENSVRVPLEFEESGEFNPLL